MGLWSNATVSLTNGLCVVSEGGIELGKIPVVSGVPNPPPSTATLGLDVIRDDGQVMTYFPVGPDFVSQTGNRLKVTETMSGYTVIDENESTESYDTNGVLQSLTTRAGTSQTMTYDGSGRLSTVSDDFGHALTLDYDSSGRLETVTDSASGVTEYAYDSEDRLSVVTHQDSTTRTYVYEDSTFIDHLTGIIDESSERFSTWSYDTIGRGVSAELAGGANGATLVYQSNGTVTVTDALGAVRTFSYQSIGARNVITGISGSSCPGCDAGAGVAYDGNWFVKKRTDYNGNVTCYKNSNDERGLELVRVEGFAPSTTCPSNLSSYTPATNTAEKKLQRRGNQRTVFQLPSRSKIARLRLHTTPMATC